MNVQLRNDIYWVGAIDWNLRDFHGYVTGRGATYNAYLIVDEKTTLIDTVKEPFYPEMIERIRAVIDPADIRYLICNHIEKDHSSSLPLLLRQFPNITVLASKMAIPGLKKYYGEAVPVQAVTSGDTLALGRRTLQFLETPMVHWPDSMFSYLDGDRLLFSMDGFGQHLAGPGRFDDEVDEAVLHYEMKKYYANLLMHLGGLIQTTLKKVMDMNLAIDMIAPSHGVIWRTNPGLAIQRYSRWSCHTPKPRALIVYDTMWKSTERMAAMLTESFMDAGIDVQQMKLRENHRSDVMAEMLDAGAVLIGSPTIHRQLFPTVADLLCYMQGLKPQNKITAAFGSYGWSGEAPALIADVLQGIGLEVVAPPVRATYLPDDSDHLALQELAVQVAQKLAGLTAPA